jgi:hypothetical protein
MAVPQIPIKKTRIYSFQNRPVSRMAKINYLDVSS